MEQLSSLNIDFQKVKRIHLEHDYNPASVSCEYFDLDKNFRYNNELGQSETKFDFPPIWGSFYDIDKYDRLSELSQEVEFEGVDYAIAFEGLIKLQSYKLVKMAFSRKTTLAKLTEFLGNQ